jgi:hypothetical protein
VLAQIVHRVVVPSGGAWLGTADAMGAGGMPVWHGVPDVLGDGDWILSMCIEVLELSSPVTELLKVSSKLMKLC